MRDLPQAVESAQARLTPLLAEFGIQMPGSFADVLSQLHIDSKQVAQAVAPAGRALGSLLGGTVSFLGALIGALMVPVFAAYLLYDFDRITAGIGALVPTRHRIAVTQIAKDVDAVLGEFFRGQLIVMLILALAYSVAYSLLGVRLAVVIGLAAGLLSFIPYVGGAAALGMALIMCLFDWQGWWQLGGVVAAYSFVQVLEGFVITPRIVGDKVGLSAVWVLFALAVGGELFGFMGVLLALPAAAVGKIFVTRGMNWYRSSELFLGTSNERQMG